MSAEIYLNIDEPNFEKAKVAARKRAVDELGEDGKTDFLWDETKLKYDPKEYPEFKDGRMRMGGELPFGYFSIDFDLDLETVIAIIEFYQKRLNKLKTVLEGIK